MRHSKNRSAEHYGATNCSVLKRSFSTPPSLYKHDKTTKTYFKSVRESCNPFHKPSSSLREKQRSDIERTPATISDPITSLASSNCPTTQKRTKTSPRLLSHGLKNSKNILTNLSKECLSIDRCVTVHEFSKKPENHSLSSKGRPESATNKTQTPTNTSTNSISLAPVSFESRSSPSTFRNGTDGDLRRLDAELKILPFKEVYDLLAKLTELTEEPERWSLGAEKLRSILQSYGKMELKNLQRSFERLTTRSKLRIPRKNGFNSGQTVVEFLKNIRTDHEIAWPRRSKRSETDTQKIPTHILRQLSSPMGSQDHLVATSRSAEFSKCETMSLPDGAPGEREANFLVISNPVSTRAVLSRKSSRAADQENSIIIFTGTIGNSSYEAYLQERVAIITSLHQNVAAIQTLLAQREARVVYMVYKLKYLKNRGGQLNNQSHRANDHRSQQRFLKLTRLESEIKKQTKFLESIKPRIQTLTKHVHRQITFLRNTLMDLRLGPAMSTISKHVTSSLLSRLDRKSNVEFEILKSNWGSCSYDHSQLFRLRHDVMLTSITDCDLKEFIKNYPNYSDILSKHPQAPAVLEALEFDGVSFLFSGLGSCYPEGERENRDLTEEGKWYSISIVSILAHWIEENPFFYKLGLDECFFPLDVWELLSERISRIRRLTDVALTRCRISGVILRILLKGLRRNPISILDLGYNKLGSEGMNLLTKGLFVEHTRKRNSKVHHFSEKNISVLCMDESASDGRLLTASCPTRNSEIKEESTISLEKTIPKSAVNYKKNNTIDPLVSLNSMSRSIKHKAKKEDPSLQSAVDLPALGLNLTQLLLPVNNLGDKGAVLVAQILRSNSVPHLRSIDLSWNNIGVEGAAALGSALTYRSRHRVMDTLGICNEGLNINADDTNKSTNSSYESTPHLWKLNLAGNRIKANGAASLISSLALAADLLLVKNLNLSMNRINNDIFPSLESWVAAVASENSSHVTIFDTTSVKFDWNSLSDISAVQRLVCSLSSPLFTKGSTEGSLLSSKTDPTIDLRNNDLAMANGSSIFAVTQGRLSITG